MFLREADDISAAVAKVKIFLIMTSEICNRRVFVPRRRTIRFHVVSVTFHWHIKTIISDFNLRLTRAIGAGKRSRIRESYIHV